MSEEPIPEVQLVVEKAAGCPAKHIESVIVVEGWKDEVVWEGDFTAVLEISTVDSPNTAVKVAIAAKARE